MDPDQPSPWNDKDPTRKQDRLAISSSNMADKDILQQSEGQARSNRPQEGRISLCGGSLYTSGPYRRGGLGLYRGKGLLGPYDPSRQQVRSQYRISDLGWNRSKGLLGPYHAPRQQVRTPFLSPKKRAMESPESHSHYYRNGHNDNSRQPVNMPQLPSENSPRPQSVSPPNTGLSSHMTMSAEAPLKSCNIDAASMRPRNDQDDLLALSSWRARKRLNAKTTFDNVEEVGNVNARKKTRLDWGQGLAKYEKQQKEKQLLNAQEIEANSDLNNSSTSMTKTMVYPAGFPAFAHGCIPSPGANDELNNSSTSMIETIVCPAALPASSEGSNPPQAVGAHGDLEANGELINTSTSMTETIVCSAALPASSNRCSRPQAAGAIGGLGNSRMSLTETIIRTTDIPAISHARSLPPAAGANGELINSSTRMTETMVCPAVLPASSIGCCSPPDVGANNDDNWNSSMGSVTVVCPADVPSLCHGCSSPGEGSLGDLGNSSIRMTETVVYPTVLTASSNVGCILPQVVGANNGDLGNSDMSLSETVVCPAEMPALSHGCNPPLDVGTNGHLVNSSMSMTETILYPIILSALSHGCSLPPAVGDNNGDHGNSSTSLSETVVCPADVSALCHEHRLPPDVGANGDVGNRSIGRTEMIVPTTIVPAFSHGSVGANNCDHDNSSMSLSETVVCPAEMPALSQEHSSPQDVETIGDHGNSRIITTEMVVYRTIVPAFSGGCNLPPGANGDIGNSSISLTETAVCQADRPAFSPGCSSPPVSGDNADTSNSSTSMTETVMFPATLAPSFHGCNPLPGGIFSTSTKSQDIPHNLMSKCSNKIQSNARMTAIILEKLQAPRKFLKKNAINTDCGDGGNYPVSGSSGQGRSGRMNFSESCSDKITKNTVDGDQNRRSKENSEICTVLNEYDGAAETETDTKDNDDNVKTDKENPQPCAASKECSAIQLSCDMDSHKTENVDIIPSLGGNVFSAPLMQTSDEEHKISHLSSSSGAVALPTNHAKTSGVKMGTDLNVPLDVASIDVDSSHPRGSVNLDTNHAEASMDPNATRWITQFDLNIPDPALMEAESNDRGRITFDFGGTNEMADDVTHVHKNQQCRTTMPANQPRCIMLFGKLICQAPSSDTNPTSNQDYHIDGRPCGIPPNRVVPFAARDGQTYSSGPGSTWSSTPINPSQQSVFSNQMPYGLVNGDAASPLQSMSSAFVNWSQQTHSVNMTPYSMMGGGVGYHLRPGSSTSSSLVNFIPRQQPWTSWALDPSRMVTGYPCLPDTTRNQASGVTPSRPNGEGTSRSNTRKGKEKRR